MAPAMLSYHEFRTGTKGRIIADLIAHPDSIAEMERRSRRREPAVTAIDRAIVDEVGRLSDAERQHTGRVIRDVLAPLGWRPTTRKRLRGSHTFASGAVYEQPVATGSSDHSARRLSALANDCLTRADAAVAILTRARVGDAGTVDDFIAERRAEAYRDDNDQ